MNKLRVNMVSESEFTIQGHGVHTAYREMTDALSANSHCDILVNKHRRADITHVHTIGMYSLTHLLFGSGKKVASVHIVPDSLVGSIIAARYWMPVMRAYMKFFYSRADLNLAVSNNVAEILKNDLKIKRPIIKTMYNTIDMSRYKTTASDRDKARRALGIDDTEFVVVGNGQLQPRKRLDSFVESARQMPSSKFIWIGGIPFKALGAEVARMHRLKKLAPPNVHFTGLIDHAEVLAYLQAADVFFLPAEQENHPMCVLEAAGAGLPVVLRHIHEYDDTFRDDALLGDDTSFASILSRLRDDKTYAAKARAGSENIAKRFDSKTGSEVLLDHYEALLRQ